MQPRHAPCDDDGDKAYAPAAGLLAMTPFLGSRRGSRYAEAFYKAAADKVGIPWKRVTNDALLARLTKRQVEELRPTVDALRFGAFPRPRSDRRAEAKRRAAVARGDHGGPRRARRADADRGAAVGRYASWFEGKLCTTMEESARAPS